MNKAHKWAKEITHLVNGGEVEYRLTKNYINREDSYSRLPSHCLSFFGDDDYEFRIKPQKKTMEVAVYTSEYGTDVWIAGEHPTGFQLISDIITIEYEDPQT